MSETRTIFSIIIFLTGITTEQPHILDAISFKQKGNFDYESA
jgi:hypothetical protein